MSAINLKVGDTLLANCTYKDEDGNPVDLALAGITVSSWVRSTNGLTRWPLVVTPGVDAGTFTISGDTSDWVPGCLDWDIRYTTSDFSHSTETMKVHLGGRVS